MRISPGQLPWRRVPLQSIKAIAMCWEKAKSTRPSCDLSLLSSLLPPLYSLQYPLTVSTSTPSCFSTIEFRILDRFLALIADGVTTPNYKYVRKNTNYNSPVTNATSIDFRCNVGGLESAASTSTYTVAAGSTVTNYQSDLFYNLTTRSQIGFALDTAIYHPGVINGELHNSRCFSQINI